MVFALGTAVAWSIYGLVARVLAKDSSSPLALSVSYGIYSALFALVPLLWEPWIFSGITSTVLFVTFLATFFFGVYDIFQFYGRKHLEASQSTVLFQVAPIVTFLVAVALLHESFTLAKAVAIGLIVLGNVLALYQRNTAFPIRGVLYMLIIASALGCAYVADKFSLPHYPLPLYASITYFVPALYCLLVILARRSPVKSITEEMRRGGWRVPFLAALGVVGYYFSLKAVLLTEVSRVLPIMYCSTILTALGGILILKERGSVPQKLIGAVITVLGVLLLQTA